MELTKESREIPERRASSQTVTSEGNRLIGLAIPFNSPSSPISRNGKTWIEYIDPSAFDTSLATGRSKTENRPITFVAKHDDISEIGDTETNLKLTKSDAGISFVLDLPDYARTIRELVENGSMKDMSFEFYCLKDKWEGNNRTVLDADLVHISIVQSGAYPQAFVELREKVSTWKQRNNLLRKKMKGRCK